LSCKACQGQCPIKVDVPDFKAKFLALYYQRYLRPPGDLLAREVESTAQSQYEWSEVFNYLVGHPLVRLLLEKIFGLVDPPCFSQVDLQAGLAERHALLGWNDHFSPLDPAKDVLLVQDAFTSFYETELVLRLHDFFSEIGIKMHVLPFSENGKAKHVKGFLPEFKSTAEKTSQKLEQIGKYGIPMIGLDPAVALTYRDEYPKILGRDLNFQVLLIEEYLAQILPQLELPQLSASRLIKLFAHCTEKTSLPAAEGMWVAIFKSFGLELQVEPVGCCGMGGLYGHEAKHRQSSFQIFDLHWRDRLLQAEQEGAWVLATGYSCRSQVKRFEGYKPLHPLELILDLIQ